MEKHWEAYADIPWDDPEYAVDKTTPAGSFRRSTRSARPSGTGRSRTEVQAQIGLWRVATAMKIGLQFENLLKRGLLNYAYRLPNGRPEFRYVYHEMTEEMSPRDDVPGVREPDEDADPRHAALAERHRAGGPAGSRSSAPSCSSSSCSAARTRSTTSSASPSRAGTIKHPLEETIMRIHIAEEARHISFARHYLKPGCRSMHPVRRRILRPATPVDPRHDGADHAGPRRPDGAALQHPEGGRPRGVQGQPRGQARDGQLGRARSAT